MILAWLLASAGLLSAATFNVTAYGALADDSTDNTAAFTACLNAVIAAGGGKMYLPDGVYRGRITIPPQGGPSWITIEIVGESEPPPVWGTIGNFPPRDEGTIVKSLATSGAAVISAASGSLYSGFSGVYVVIRNLDVRTYNNPQISGIDLNYAAQCRLENVAVTTGVYNVQASQPTYGTKGIVTPANNNAALTILRNVLVTGYHTGIVVREHTDGDHIMLGSNIHGLDFTDAHHASRFGRVCAQRNTHHVTVSGTHGFTIEQLNIEKAGAGQTDANNAWQATVYDLNDPNNRGIGDIDDWVVLGGTGAVADFVINGGANIRTRRIGTSSISPPPPPGPTDLNGSFETPEVGATGYLEIPVGGTIGGWIHQSGSFSAWLVAETYASPQFPAAVDGDQMLEFDHRSNPHSLIYRSAGTTGFAGDVTASAHFALRNFNAGPPVPGAGFRLLLLSGTPGGFTTLADSGVLTHAAAKTWVKHSVTAADVPAGTEVFVALQANFWGTSTNHVFTVVDDVRVTLPVPFVITDFTREAGAGSVTLTWTSRPDRSYRVVSSTGLDVWSHELGQNLGSAQDENPDDGERITVTFNLADFLLEQEPKLFFRVEEE
jgi:hypothetical protein